MRYAAECSKQDFRALLNLSIPMQSYEMNSIFRAGLDGKLTFTVLDRGMLVASATLLASGRSLVGLGDYGPLGSGPSGWPQAPELIRWSQATLLQCTRGFRSHYNWLTAQTLEGKRTLLIETDLWHLSAWNQMLKDYECKSSLVRVAVPMDRAAERVPTPISVKGRRS
jgi:hypothetical protein